MTTIITFEGEKASGKTIIANALAQTLTDVVFAMGDSTLAGIRQTTKLKNPRWVIIDENRFTNEKLASLKNKVVNIKLSKVA